MTEKTIVDVYKLPIWYISFKKSEELENMMMSAGFNRPNHFKAVNGKELDLEKVVSQGYVTIRGYNDIKHGRKSHEGLPTKGAIGCTMSHYALWHKCVEEGYSHIIILEDDLILHNNFKEYAPKISEYISQDDSIFIASGVSDMGYNDRYVVTGLQFYIMSNGACKTAIQQAFPIDIQTDWYLDYLNTLGKVKIYNKNITSQKSHKSNIQDSYSVKKNVSNYSFGCTIVSVSVVIIVIIVIAIYFYKQYENCKTTCNNKCPPCSVNSTRTIASL